MNPRTPTGLDPERVGLENGSEDLESRKKPYPYIIDFREYEEEWFEWCKINAPSTARVYRSFLQKHYYRGFNSPSEMLMVSNELSKDRMNAIRNFMRFLVETGKRRQSEVIDFQAVVKPSKSRPAKETEMYVDSEEINEAYQHIVGRSFNRRNLKEERQVGYKLLAFTGLRVTEVAAMLSTYDPGLVEKAYKAYRIPEEIQEKLAVYPMDEVEILTRKAATKKSYVAIFPKELLKEIRVYPDITAKTMESKCMMPDVDLNLKQIRKWTYNFFVDRAITNQEGELAEFIQGRTSDKVGTRNYRFKVRAGAKFYYDKILEDIKKELCNLID